MIWNLKFETCRLQIQYFFLRLKRKPIFINAYIDIAHFLLSFFGKSVFFSLLRQFSTLNFIFREQKINMNEWMNKRERKNQKRTKYLIIYAKNKKMKKINKSIFFLNIPFVFHTLFLSSRIHSQNTLVFLSRRGSSLIESAYIYNIIINSYPLCSLDSSLNRLTDSLNC